MVNCSKCGVDKSPKLFFASSRAKNGLQSSCKACQMGLIRANSAAARARAERYKASKPAEAMYRHLARRAAKLGVPCLEREVFCVWYYQQTQKCAYCGDDSTTAIEKYGHKLHIDRKDGRLGYAARNLCLACQRCNMVKSSYLTHDQMKEVAARYFAKAEGR